MALSDYLTGKNPFEESDDATVATGKGGTPIKQKESVYVKSNNPFISDTRTLRHLGSSPEISCDQTVTSCCDTSATLATLECLKPDCSCTESESADCIFLDVAAAIAGANLHTPQKDGVFSLAGFTCIASVVRKSPHHHHHPSVG